MNFAGVYPILYAFTDSDGRLDENAMRLQIRSCLAVGAHGIAVLGLITEVNDLTQDERRAIVAWASDEIAGRVPLSVTIGTDNLETQIRAAREAINLGADWLVFQPTVGADDEASLKRAFGYLADVIDVNMGIQNAPQFLGRGLSHGAISDLHRQHANFCVIKGESSATDIARLHDACGETLAIFNGRGGLELPDVLRAGCVGMIPAPECCDVQVKIYEAMQRGDEALAQALYAQVLPLIIFVMQSIEASLTYGKRITARRLGLGEVYDRTPSLAPTQFGLDCATARAAQLPLFPKG